MSLDLVGVVEGFYGPPWTADERIEMVRFEAAAGMNAYLYAPKFDPWHLERWREPYPPQALADLVRVAREAEAAGVRFIYAVGPALDMRFADDAEHATLAAKCDQLFDAGIREFALLFDDVPEELPDAADRGRFGDGPAGSGAAHGAAAARFAETFLARHAIDAPFLVCPSHYGGTGRSPYRDAFAAALPASAVVLWTGHDVVVGEVTAQHARDAQAAFGHPLVLWDNFPVNDFDFSRLFLGPLLGRDPELADVLRGILANPMPRRRRRGGGGRGAAAGRRRQLAALGRPRSRSDRRGARRDRGRRRGRRGRRPPLPRAGRHDRRGPPGRPARLARPLDRRRPDHGRDRTARARGARRGRRRRRPRYRGRAAGRRGEGRAPRHHAGAGRGGYSRCARLSRA
jgi:hypothetical protein